MVWIVAALSALCIFTAAGTALVVRHMIGLRRGYASFRCKIRVRGGWLSGFQTTWPKRISRAMWARDVLIVFRGFGLLKMWPLPVASAEGAVHNLPRSEVSRLGSDPVALVLVLDDGPRLQVAASAEERDLLCGPYLVADAIPDRGSQSSR